MRSWNEEGLPRVGESTYALTPSGREALYRLEEDISGKNWKEVPTKKLDRYYHLLWCDGLDPEAEKFPRSTSESMNRTFPQDLGEFLRRGWVVKLDTSSVDSLLTLLKKQDSGQTSSRLDSMYRFPKGAYRAMSTYTSIAREEQVSEAEIDRAIDWFETQVSLGMQAHDPKGYRKLKNKVRIAKFGTRVEKVLILDELVQNIHDQLAASKESTVPGNPGTTMFQILSKLERGED